MCFVLDACSFHRFFNPLSNDFYDFEPLHDWLYKKNGTKLVYGGTTYIKEIEHLKKYRGYLVELSKISKFVQIEKKLVDEESDKIRAAVNNSDFDDPHIIALLAVSGCLLFASHDTRADKFVKRRDLYPKNTHKRSIYRKRQHSDLLTADKIVNLQNIKK